MMLYARADMPIVALAFSESGETIFLTKNDQHQRNPAFIMVCRMLQIKQKNMELTP